jgi:uncharacterized Zn-finger protein
MPKPKCETCNKEFTKKAQLTYHIKHKSCKIRDFSCKYCDKGFTTDNSMYRHMKHSCKIKKKEDAKRDIILERLIKLEEENKELKEEMKKMKQVNNITNNKINNGTINNGTINNIVLIGHGKEDLSKIDNKDILKCLKKGFYSTIHLTETVHFNPKYPEYHNVYISNIKDKYAMMYDGKEWSLTRKTELIDRLYEDKKNYIEDNMEYFLETLTRSQIRALERWLNTDDEHDKIKEVKDKIKLLLYNKREVVIDG